MIHLSLYNVFIDKFCRSKEKLLMQKCWILNRGCNSLFAIKLCFPTNYKQKRFFVFLLYLYQCMCMCFNKGNTIRRWKRYWTKNTHTFMARRDYIKYIIHRISVFFIFSWKINADFLFLSYLYPIIILTLKSKSKREYMYVYIVSVIKKNRQVEKEHTLAVYRVTDT